MAIRPIIQYPTQVDGSDPGYPHGKAQNVTAPGSGDGTPWEAADANDIFGFQQALLAETATTPSGTPDKVGASQYLDSINAIIRKSSASNAARNWRESPTLSGLDGLTGTFGVAGSSEWWVSVGSSTVTGSFAGIFFARDAGGTWALSTRTGAEANGVSWDPVNLLFVAAGNGGVVYTAADPSSTWATQSLGSTKLNTAHTSVAGNTVVAGDYNGIQIEAHRATDGLSYTPIVMAGSSGDRARSIASAGTTMVAVGHTSAGVPLIWRSTTSGGAFTAGAIPGGLTDALLSVTWNGAVFVILGDDGQIATSATGADGTWTVQSSLPGVTAGQGITVAADPATGVILALVSGTIRLQVSVDDGVSFSSVPHPPVGSGWNSLGFGVAGWALSFRDNNNFVGAQSQVRA